MPPRFLPEPEIEAGWRVVISGMARVVHRVAPPANGPIAIASRQGLLIPQAAFVARLGGSDKLKKVLNALTVMEAPSPGKPRFMARKTASAYGYVRIGKEQHLCIPRIKGRALLRAGAISEIIDDPTPLPPPRILSDQACAIAVPLYSYQEAAVDYICGGPLSEEAANAHAANHYQQMDTGLGKTRVAGGVIAKKRVPAVVVVPTEAIRQQWIDEFAEVFPGLKCGAYVNFPKDSRKVAPSAATHDVVVFIVNTFREKDSSVLDGFGMVIFDEAHEFHSPVNRKSLWLSQTRYVLGLSATPEQDSSRNLDRYVFFHLGTPVAQESIPNFDATEANFLGRVRKVEYAGQPEYCESAVTSAGTMSAVGTIGNVIKDPARLALVTAEVNRLLHMHEQAGAAKNGLGPHPDDGHIRRHGVFVFAEHREYLPDLRTALIAHFGKDEVMAPELEEAKSVSVLRGGVAKNAVQNARKIGAHIVLTTYGYSRRGISLPDMTALVKATPRRHGGVQIIGRILRRGSDQTILREVVDIVDMRTGLKSQYGDRKKDYEKKGWPISVVKASWEDYAIKKNPEIADGEPEPDEDSEAEVETTLDDVFEDIE
jgi:hypothetical protein